MHSPTPSAPHSHPRSTLIFILVLFFSFSTVLGSVLPLLSPNHGVASLEARSYDQVKPRSPKAKPVTRDKIIPGKLFVVGRDVVYAKNDPFRPPGKVVVTALDELQEGQNDLRVLYLTRSVMSGRVELSASSYIPLASPWAFQELENKRVDVKYLEEPLATSQWGRILPPEPIEKLPSDFKVRAHELLITTHIAPTYVATTPAVINFNNYGHAYELIWGTNEDDPDLEPFRSAIFYCLGLELSEAIGRRNVLAGALTDNPACFNANSISVAQFAPKTTPPTQKWLTSPTYSCSYIVKIVVPHGKLKRYPNTQRDLSTAIAQKLKGYLNNPSSLENP